MYYDLNSEFKEKNVVIYARVSTEHEAQLSALENQVDWYKPILSARPQWKLVGQYVDEGITGTSAQKRPQFMRMINDAKKHKFNMIITREVSRFARNTVDTLQYTRLLKDEGVEVFFINDNIKTFDGDGELRLTIMATLAQDESRKTSIRVKAGQQTSMNNGVYYGNGNILGYDRIDKNTFVINPEQARTVRMIFDLYLTGHGTTAIKYELEKAGRLTAMGKINWYESVILKTLQNSFYCGIIVYHKQYTPDYLKQKKVANKGEIELTKVKGNHTPIVTEKEFEQVQRIIAKNSNKTTNNGRKPSSSVWGRIMICQCGNRFNVRYYQRKHRTPGRDFQCYTSINLGSIEEHRRRGLPTDGLCDTPFLSGWKLDLMAYHIFKNHISNVESTTKLAFSILEQHIAKKEKQPDNSEIVAQKTKEAEKLRKKITHLIEMREDGDIDREYFRMKKMKYESKLTILSNEILELSQISISEIKQDFVGRIEDLEKQLLSYVQPDSMVIPDSVVEAFIEKIWISKDEFRWYLRTNKEETEGELEHIKIASFTLTLKDAQDYVYSFSTRRRIFNWSDLNVSVWI